MVYLHNYSDKMSYFLFLRINTIRQIQFEYRNTSVNDNANGNGAIICKPYCNDLKC